MHVIVLLDGQAPTREALDGAWPGWATGAGLVVAADGGATVAGALGLAIDRWVGDGDSLGAEGLAALRARGVAIREFPADKDATDGELAVVEAIGAGATMLTLVGALGGSRLDHLLANVGLLEVAAAAGVPARIVDPAARVTLVVGPGEVHLEGRLGDLVSLLPVAGTVSGVRTAGLRYALAGDSLVAGRTRGISNVRIDRRVSVGLDAGRLLVVEVPARLAP